MRRKLVEFTDEQKEFVRKNYNKLSNAAMAKMFNMNFSTFSGKVHEMGLLRMQMEYWTVEQMEFLKSNYKKIGDKEMAILFNGLWEKEKRWTWKHIEKKRLYLGLKRTAEELVAIKARNKKRGCWRNMNTWDTRGAAIIGDIRIWRFKQGYAYKVIKTKEGYRGYSRWMYENTYGPIPKGHIVTFKDEDPMNVVPENLYTMPLAENARRNRKKYPEELRQMEIFIKKFNKKLKSKQ